MTGPLSRGDLGVVHVHEHLLLGVGEGQCTEKERQQEITRATRALSDLAERGAATVVDMTNMGMGRDPVGLQSLSHTTGVAIIAATGFYFGAYIPDWVSEESVGALASIFVSELTEGIEGAGFCAGVIGEVGTGNGEITPTEHKVLCAAARAQRHTGAPVFTHTTYGTMALEQLQILEAEGADLSRVVIGHCDVFHPLEVVLEVARRGACIGIDTVGKESWRGIDGVNYQLCDDSRVRLILSLLEKGFARRIVLSSDLLVARGEAELNPGTLGAMGYTYLTRGFVPRLRAAGVCEEAIEKMLRENPSRILTR